MLRSVGAQRLKSTSHPSFWLMRERRRGSKSKCDLESESGHTSRPSMHRWLALVLSFLGDVCSIIIMLIPWCPLGPGSAGSSDMFFIQPGLSAAGRAFSHHYGVSWLQKKKVLVHGLTVNPETFSLAKISQILLQSELKSVYHFWLKLAQLFVLS